MDTFQLSATVAGSFVVMAMAIAMLYFTQQRQKDTVSRTGESRVNNSSSTVHLQKDTDANRFKNKAAVDTVIPQIFCKIIQWGCKKNETESFKSYLLRTKLKKDFDKRWASEREQKLLLGSELDSSRCDVTFLNMLIQDVCDKPDSSEKVRKGYDKMKFYLKMLTDFRNNVCHKPNEDAVSPSILTDIEETAGKFFQAASETYNIEPETVAKELKNVSGLLKDIRRKTMTEKQARLMETGNVLSSEGKNEMKEIINKQVKVSLPFSEVEVTRSSVFHHCRVRVRQTDEEKSNKRSQDGENGDKSTVLSCSQLFSDIHSRCVTIYGHPGSGKSTLLRRMREDFLSEKDEIFKGIRKFEILLYMECKNESKTIPDLLKYNFPETLQKIKDKDAVDALVTRNVLILVDGIDEATSNSNTLLRKLIEVYGSRNSVQMVFTSRPGAARPFESMSPDMGITNTEVTLQPLTEENEKIQFLKRYQETIVTSKSNVSELIDTFKSLDETCKQHLIHPVHLALFCHLFISSPDDVRKWKNELSIMDQTLKHSRQLISDRLCAENVINYEIIADQLIKNSFSLSVRQIAHNKMIIKQEAYVGLFKNLRETKGKPYYKIISGLFVSQTDQSSFEYLHKTQAEYLAAKALIKELSNRSKTSIFTIISEILHDTSDGSAIQQDDKERRKMASRFSHAFQFLVMELVESEDDRTETLERCLDEFCPILAKEKMPVDYWLDLTASCPSSELVAKAAAEAAKESTDWEGWTVSSDRHMRAAARMLPYFQPSELTVWPQQSPTLLSHLENVLKTVATWHTGGVRLELTDSYWKLKPADDWIDLLKSENCRITRFRGCLISKHSQDVVCEAARRAEKDVFLFISLLEPREHKLAQLDGVDHRLVVRAQLTDRIQGRRPLPGGSRFPPSLTVVCTPATERTEVEELIEDLAPENKIRYQVRSAIKMASTKTIACPMSEVQEKYIFEEDKAIAKDNNYKPELGGKWMLFYPIDSMDSMWEKSCLLYRKRKFTGIHSIKTSTAKTNDRQNTFTKGVIMFHCGPSDDETLMKKYGRNIVRRLKYFDEIGTVSYKTDVQSEMGTRATGNTNNALYKIPVLINSSSASSEEGDTEEEYATEEENATGVGTDRDAPKAGESSAPVGTESALLAEPKEGSHGYTQVETQSVTQRETQKEIQRGIQEEIQEEVREAYRAKRYDALWLQDWPGSEDDLNLLVWSLSKASVRTAGNSGKARWAPAGKDRRGRCEVCDREDHSEGNEQRCVRLFLPEGPSLSEE